MKNKKHLWRMIYLLPLATGIYLKNQLKAKNPKAIAVLVVLCLLIAGAVCIPVFSSGSKKLSEETVTAVSPSIAPTPSPSVTPEPVTVTLSFAGDCTLGMDRSFTYSTSFNAMYEEKGAEYFLENVREIFAADDLTVVNFEGTLTDSDDRANKSWAFKGDRDYIRVLSSSSVEVANIANNHIQDYGDTGLSDTIDCLTGAGIEHFGFEDTCIIEVNGIKVGFTGLYTVYEDPAHLEQLKENIETLQNAGAQLIIANFHWGLELDYYPEADQVELAHAAIDAGAHLVIGHHPHVLQGVEVYKGRCIAYSLGNFCFGGNAIPPDYDCMIFQQTFTLYGDTVETDINAQVIPCMVSSTTAYNNYCPTPAEGTVKERILEKLRGLSEDLGETNFFDP